MAYNEFIDRRKKVDLTDKLMQDWASGKPEEKEFIRDYVINDLSKGDEILKPKSMGEVEAIKRDDRAIEVNLTRIGARDRKEAKDYFPTHKDDIIDEIPADKLKDRVYEIPLEGNVNSEVDPHQRAYSNLRVALGEVNEGGINRERLVNVAFEDLKEYVEEHIAEDERRITQEAIYAGMIASDSSAIRVVAQLANRRKNRMNGILDDDDKKDGYAREKLRVMDDNRAAEVVYQLR